MKRMRIFFIAGAMAIITAAPVVAKDDSDSGSRLATGAAVGAGTNVIGGAVLDSLDGSSKPQYTQVQGPDGNWYWQEVPREDPNKVILKRAVQGAITGAVAAEVAKDDGKSGESGKSDVVSTLTPSAQKAGEREDEEDGQGGDHKHHKKHKEHHRPPGWDKGKKVGWEGGDVPPGLRNKSDE